MYDDNMRFLLARMLVALVCTIVTGVPLWLYFGVVGVIPFYMWFSSFYLLWIVLFLLIGGGDRREKK